MRDPRIDPLPGDLLRKGDTWKMVLATDLEWIWVTPAEKVDGEWLGSTIGRRKISWADYRRDAPLVDEAIPAESEVPA